MTNSPPILSRNPKCGQRIGQDGKCLPPSLDSYCLPVQPSDFIYMFLHFDFLKYLEYARFLSFGGAVPYRPVEDIAFAVARFFQLGGTFQNYYMVLNLYWGFMFTRFL